jgi:hypothetical protein
MPFPRLAISHINLSEANPASGRGLGADPLEYSTLGVNPLLGGRTRFRPLRLMNGVRLRSTRIASNDCWRWPRASAPAQLILGDRQCSRHPPSFRLSISAVITSTNLARRISPACRRSVMAEGMHRDDGRRFSTEVSRRITCRAARCHGASKHLSLRCPETGPPSHSGVQSACSGTESCNRKRRRSPAIQRTSQTFHANNNRRAAE